MELLTPLFLPWIFWLQTIGLTMMTVGVLTETKAIPRKQGDRAILVLATVYLLSCIAGNVILSAAAISDFWRS